MQISRCDVAHFANVGLAYWRSHRRSDRRFLHGILIGLPSLVFMLLGCRASLGRYRPDWWRRVMLFFECSLRRFHGRWRCVAHLGTIEWLSGRQSRGRAHRSKLAARWIGCGLGLGVLLDCMILFRSDTNIMMQSMMLTKSPTR